VENVLIVCSQIAAIASIVKMRKNLGDKTNRNRVAFTGEYVLPYLQEPMVTIQDIMM